MKLLLIGMMLALCCGMGAQEPTRPIYPTAATVELVSVISRPVSVCEERFPDGERLLLRCPEDLEPPPFDVPPKEWDGPEVYYPQTCNGGVCYGDTAVPVRHHSCEDKSRFLLTSEDGKWHCLALVPK